MRRDRVGMAVLAFVLALSVTACTDADPSEGTSGPAAADSTATSRAPASGLSPTAMATGAPSETAITLAFAGDIHFEGHLLQLLDRPHPLGRMTRVLLRADITMVNLETALTDRGAPQPKEYQFRAPTRATKVLAEAGIDVVTMANNHAADYGATGFADTLHARDHPLPIVGIGDDAAEAYRPYVADVRGTSIAFIAADTVPLQSTDPIWTAGIDQPGVANARDRWSRDQLLAAVGAASRAQDVVVVFMHWGEENVACPTADQLRLERALSDAGADIIVGSHSHVPMGAGWRAGSGSRTYVAYGLGNFVWYHDRSPPTGVLELTVQDGRVTSDRWLPAVITPSGAPRPVTGEARRVEAAAWRSLRGCTTLLADANPSSEGVVAEPAHYRARVRPLDATQKARMLGVTYRPGCPVGLQDLRYLRLRYIDFAGRTQWGELVVRRHLADDVADAFGVLYRARFPIYSMRLPEEYAGDNDAMLAANNTSAFNCRRVKGTERWSDHALGAAVDINPLQNPYVLPGEVRPPSGFVFSQLDRQGSDPLPTGVIRDRDDVVGAFTAIGWRWGAAFGDFQHFYRP